MEIDLTLSGPEARCILSGLRAKLSVLESLRADHGSSQQLQDDVYLTAALMLTVGGRLREVARLSGGKGTASPNAPDRQEPVQFPVRSRAGASGRTRPTTPETDTPRAQEPPTGRTAASPNAQPEVPRA